jgi:hypothetical protein
MPQDGSIVSGQLPLLGPQESLPGCGRGSMGRSRPTSAVVHTLVVAPDSTMGLLHLGGGPDDQLP